MVRIRSLMIAAALIAACPAPVLARRAEPVAAVPAAPTPQRARMNQRVFDRVWREVERNYYDPGLNGLDWDAARALYGPQAIAAPDDRELYRVLSAMLDGLDDEHANVSEPAAVQRRIDNRQPRALLGVSLRREGERWRIDNVRDDSPAEAAEVPIGWVLEAIDGRPWGPEIDLTDAVPVTLTLEDEAGQDHILTITPRILPPPEIFSVRWAAHDVMVLDIESFDQGLGVWMGTMLAALPEGADVVLDLRGNPGGRLDEAQSVLSCFLPEGLDWATRTSRAGRDSTLTLFSGCGDLEAPVDAELIVLVDQASRSSSELTPAVLQEQGRARVYGEQTPGSVLISQDTRLPDGGELSLSRSNFVTAGGVRLEKRGVTPDVAVERTVEDRRSDRDPVMDAAVAALSEAG